MGFEYKTLKELTLDGKGQYGVGASAVDFHESLPTYLRITDITEDGNLIRDGLKSVNHSNSKKYILKKNDIVFARTGNSTGKSYFYEENDGELVYAGFLIKFSLDPKKVNPRYIKYFTLTNEYQGWIQSNFTGSTRPNINAQGYGQLLIPLIPRKKQDSLVLILSSIDEKIRNNQGIIANLEELSQTLFKRWFIEFEFPNEEGNSYKTYRGKMMDSELGEIPKGWQVLRLEDIAHSYNTVRKPLSKLEREKQENNYPYYGATKIIDYVGDYLFDGKYILVGEDGTVKTDEGSPFTQYIWGQFWVSNHAHVLKGKTISDELLLLNLKNIYIEPFITGAVQPKLNKKNLNSIKFLQADESTLSKFERIIQPIYGKVRELTDESNYLRELRDTLLPKLMSGEIELPDELEVDEHAELLQ